MIKIESKDNVLFKSTKKLKERKHRTKENKFIIEGFRLVEEALKAKCKFEYIILCENHYDKAEKYLNEHIDNIKCYEMTEILFSQLCSTENPQGVIAVLSQNNDMKNIEGNFFLLCDKVQDPGNIGTIIRSAHAAGVSAILLTKGTVDIYNDKAIRATMGSIFYVPIIYDNDLSYTKALINKGFDLLTTSLQGSKNFFLEDLRGNIILAVGNEGNGVSDEVYDISTKKVKIPMPGGAESLNVAIASSIILFEKVRQETIK